MRKHTLLFFLMIVFSCSIYGQESTVIDNTWKLNASKNGVYFYHKIIKCNGADAVLLGLKNTNSNAVMVTWEEELTIDNVTRSNEERMRSLFLPSGELLQVDCVPTKIPFMIVPISNYSGNNAIINSYQYNKLEVHSN